MPSSIHPDPSNYQDDHVDLIMKDANTKVIATHEITQAQWLNENIVIATNFGDPLTFTTVQGTFRYRDQTCSLNGKMMVPGVHARSMGDPDENSIQ